MKLPSIGVVHWGSRDELAEAVAECFGALGHPVIAISPTQMANEHVDVVFTMGPFGPLLAPPGDGGSPMPPLAIWHTEQFWDPRLPTWIGRRISWLRSAWERRTISVKTSHWAALWPAMEFMVRRGHRFRYFGDLMWLQQSGALRVLATPSAWTSCFLVQRGLPARHVNLGSHATWGADLGLERDIPVLWIGKTGSRRRARRLDQIETALAQRGVRLLRIDGVRHPYVFGRERVELLNRAQIVLNIMRQPHDSNMLRLYLAAPNRAMMISEPTLPHAPFLHNHHIVYAPIDQMADRVMHFLAHEDERRAIADGAQRLVTTELTMLRAVDSFSRLLVENSPKLIWGEIAVVKPCKLERGERWS